MASIHDYQWWITDAPSLIFTEERGRLYIGYIPGINFMYSGAVDLLQIRYAVIFAWFCPCSIGWFWPIFLFSLWDINLTLGLLPPRRHVVWRDSVGVRSSRSGLKSECADIFSSKPDLWLLRRTDEPQRGRNSCLWLQSRYVLSSFGVVLMSCRVNFHVVRSALQYSACRI